MRLVASTVWAGDRDPGPPFDMCRTCFGPPNVRPTGAAKPSFRLVGDNTTDVLAAFKMHHATAEPADVTGSSLSK